MNSPPQEMTAEKLREIAHSYAVLYGNQVKDGVPPGALKLLRWADELEIGARVAVVRPTRDALANTIQLAHHPSPRSTYMGEIVERCARCASVADALLAEFWPGTPEPADEGDAT